MRPSSDSEISRCLLRGSHTKQSCFRTGLYKKTRARGRASFVKSIYDDLKARSGDVSVDTDGDLAAFSNGHHRQVQLSDVIPCCEDPLSGRLSCVLIRDDPALAVYLQNLRHIGQTRVGAQLRGKSQQVCAYGECRTPDGDRPTLPSWSARP